MALTTTAGITSDVASVDVLAPGYTIPELLARGKEVMASEYHRYWDMAGIRPLNDFFQFNGFSYTVAGHGVSMAGGGTAPIGVSFRVVPNEIVTAMWVHYTGSAGSAPGAAADVTGPILRWGTLNGTVRVVQVMVQP